MTLEAAGDRVTDVTIKTNLPIIDQRAQGSKG